jgi:hypothetical protein
MSYQMLNIMTHSNTVCEQEARAQLLRIVETYDVEKWLFTKEVLIHEGERPHSHPVLTLHCRHLRCDHCQLTLFLHEQMHWFLSDYSQTLKVNAAIQNFGSGSKLTDTREL